MTKADLIGKISTDAGVTKVAADAALNSFMTNVTKDFKRKKR